jgi:hypothetical protein
LRRQNDDLKASQSKVQTSSQVANETTALPPEYSTTPDGATKSILETMSQGDWNLLTNRFVISGGLPWLEAVMSDNGYNLQERSKDLQIVTIGQPTNSFKRAHSFVRFLLRDRAGAGYNGGCASQQAAHSIPWCYVSCDEPRRPAGLRPPVDRRASLACRVSASDADAIQKSKTRGDGRGAGVENFPLAIFFASCAHVAASLPAVRLRRRLTLDPFAFSPGPAVDLANRLANPRPMPHAHFLAQPAQ